MSKRLESEQYYVTFEMFFADVKRMFANARTYNSPETIYYKCATRCINYAKTLHFRYWDMHHYTMLYFFNISMLSWFFYFSISVHTGSRTILQTRYRQICSRQPTRISIAHKEILS